MERFFIDVILTKKLIIGGDALLKNQLNFFVENEIDITIVNEYGPTEATVGCSVFSFNTLQTSIDYNNNLWLTFAENIWLTLGILKRHASSWTVPLSVTTPKARFSR